MIKAFFQDWGCITSSKKKMFTVTHTVLTPRNSGIWAWLLPSFYLHNNPVKWELRTGSGSPAKQHGDFSLELSGPYSTLWPLQEDRHWCHCCTIKGATCWCDVLHAASSVGWSWLPLWKVPFAQAAACPVSDSRFYNIHPTCCTAV